MADHSAITDARGRHIPASHDTEFAWLIEMQGPAYLSVRDLAGCEFCWTEDHAKAIRFHSREQADLVMMAVRELRRDLFPAMLTRGACPVEHAWL